MRLRITYLCVCKAERIYENMWAADCTIICSETSDVTLFSVDCLESKEMTNE